MSKFAIGAVLKPLLRLTWFRTIRGRLYFAFGLAAGLTVIGSSFALYASRDISATMTEIVSGSIPATVELLRLAEQASSLIASAPQLMAAENDGRRAEIAGDIARQSRLLAAGLNRLRGLDPSLNDELEVANATMDEQLNALNQAVAGRIKISDQRRALVRLVRKYHEQLLEAITPAIDDANFDVMMQMQPVLPTELIESLRRLLEIQAAINLLAGLLIESSMVTDVASLSPIRDLSSSAQRHIEANLKALPASEVKAKLTGLCARLISLATDGGVATLRVSELHQIRDAEHVFSSAQLQAARLKQTVEHLTERQIKFANMLSARANSQIETGRALLIALSIGALAAAGLIAWLYVGRNIVGRLTSLAGAMRRIADGDMNTSISVGRHDEIGGMAQALLIFRQAITDVTAARQREAARAEQSEVRRRQVEIATQNFEGAVNDIVQALDEASKSMDDCAHIMAQAAQHNRTQAAATSSASMEATSNVGSVAMAAEEIAVSVEQISLQAVTSANIARQATGEATAVITAVEQLAASVGQINAVSKLIRGVAAQTNLLALNATIEAARAGEAGRGFAVVAQEVKALASQTETATLDITQQISVIELTTSKVVKAMSAIAGTITQLDKNATDISVAVQQQDAVSKEIARSANVAAERTLEVSAGIEQVSEAALKAGQIAAEVLRAGGELAERSNKLRAEVEHFLGEVRVA